MHTTADENRKFGSDLNCTELSLSERIVVDLARDLLGRGYRIFTDTWFTSSRLANFLMQNSTHLTGTIRKDRGVPFELRSAVVAPNDVAFMRKQDVLVIKAVERKESGLKTLYLLDTKDPAAKVQKTRTNRAGHQVVLQKSTSVLTYSRSMGGVDMLDGTTQPYDAGRKTTKWFHKLALHLCLLMVRNAWVLYSKCGGRKTFSDYLELSIRHLVESTGSGRKRPAGGMRRPVGPEQHFPEKIPGRATQPRPTKRCRICYSSGRSRRTVYLCNTCPGALVCAWASALRIGTRK